MIRHRDALGALECNPEDVAGPAGLQDLKLLQDAVPVLLHGIGLSLGSAEGLDPVRLERLAEVVEAVRPPWFSEHIAFTRAGGIEIGHLMPLPFNREAVETVARNVETLRKALPDGVPVALENIAYRFTLPGSDLTEAEFVRAVVEEAGVHLLLDLENVHANAANHGYDPIAFLESLPTRPGAGGPPRGRHLEGRRVRGQPHPAGAGGVLGAVGVARPARPGPSRDHRAGRRPAAFRGAARRGRPGAGDPARVSKTCSGSWPLASPTGAPPRKE